MSIKLNLEEIVGTEYVQDSAETLLQYSRDQSFVLPSKPDYIVFPRTVEQIQAIVSEANRTSTPLTPYSSGLNLHGAAVPQRGGIILDLTSMNNILEINKEDWFAIIEPGVTYQQLQDSLHLQGLRLMVPMGVPPQRSVLSSYVERDPFMAAASFEYGNHLLMDMEIVLPDGELFRTGCWNIGGRPGGYYGPGVNMPFRFWTGAQGTLGIITKLVLSVQHLSPVRKFYFLTADTLEDLIEPIRKIQMKEIGWECFGLNRFNLAALLTDEWSIPESFPAAMIPSSQFDRYRNTLPAWTLAIGLTGMPHFPEHKLSYEEEALREICSEMQLELLEEVPGAPQTGKLFLEESLRPWGILKKFCFKGSVHDLSFKIPLDTLPSIEQLKHKCISEHAYPHEDVGSYFLICERGRGVHVEHDLHCTPHISEERKKVEALWHTLSNELLEHGALYDRPYGPWAEMIYKKAPIYHKKLTQLKDEFDPQGIMNPGKLCFEGK